MQVTSEDFSKTILFLKEKDRDFDEDILLILIDSVQRLLYSKKESFEKLLKTLSDLYWCYYGEKKILIIDEEIALLILPFLENCARFKT